MKIEKNDKFVPIKPLVNKVAASAIITIDLEHFYPTVTLHTFDLKDFLFKGLILREKDFREAMKQHDWLSYKDGVLLVTNSADAIIPLWAYMVISSASEGIVQSIFHGTETEFISHYYHTFFQNFDISPYKDGRIILKGCGKKTIPPSAYMAMTQLLKPHVKSIMFGEACSAVPIYKQPRLVGN